MNRKDASVDRAFLFVVQSVLGFMWAWAGLEKLFGGGWFDGGSHFARQMPAILGLFASKNPFSWYHDFLVSAAIPNAVTFGYLVAYSESLTGIVLLLASAALVARTGGRVGHAARGAAVGALLAAVAMNANYWLASSWISISDDRINVLMALLALVLAAANGAALGIRLASRAPRLAATIRSSEVPINEYSA
jgi:hypothetical protein